MSLRTWNDEPLNPHALTHLPCKECGKPASEITPLGGMVIQQADHGYRVIIGRLCGECSVKWGLKLPA